MTFDNTKSAMEKGRGKRQVTNGQTRDKQDRKTRDKRTRRTRQTRHTHANETRLATNEKIQEERIDKKY